MPVPTKNGTLAQVRAALGGRVAHEFAGIEPNPSYETLMSGRPGAPEARFLLAVGGGSVIDGTKFVAAAARFEGALEIATSGGSVIEQALPFGTVLTLPATGSEMNSGSVVTRKATQVSSPS